MIKPGDRVLLHACWKSLPKDTGQSGMQFIGVADHRNTVALVVATTDYNDPTNPMLTVLTPFYGICHCWAQNMKSVIK